MTAKQEKVAFDKQGHYQRWSLESGDLFVADFVDGSLAMPDMPFRSYFKNGVSWRATPSGGSVKTDYAYAPDYRGEEMSADYFFSTSGAVTVTAGVSIDFSTPSSESDGVSRTTIAGADTYFLYRLTADFDGGLKLDGRYRSTSAGVLSIRYADTPPTTATTQTHGTLLIATTLTGGTTHDFQGTIPGAVAREGLYFWFVQTVTAQATWRELQLHGSFAKTRFSPHPAHATISTDTLVVEDENSPYSALRFRAIGGGAKVELRTPYAVHVTQA